MVRRRGRKSLSRCKRASLQDLLFVGVLVLVFAMSVLIGFRLSTDFNTYIQNDTVMPATAKTASTQLLGYFTSSLDNVFLFVLVGLCIVTLAMAALVRVHPIFLVFFVIGLVFVILICAILTNVYEAMASHAELQAQANQLTNISFIMARLPFLVGLFGIILMVVMYKVWQVES